MPMHIFAVWRHHPVLGWHAYQPALGDKLWLWIGRIRHYVIFGGHDAQGWPLIVHNTRRDGVCGERLRGDETFYFEEPTAENYRRRGLTVGTRQFFYRFAAVVFCLPRAADPW